MNTILTHKNNSSEFAEKMYSVCFVLGAPDPEMNFIQDSLYRLFPAAEIYVAGTVDEFGVFKRCHPGNAYAATAAKCELSSSVVPLQAATADTLGTVRGLQPVFVECNIPLVGWNGNYIMDHHNPGDRGFGGKPEHYWESSSVGQIYNLLHFWGAHPLKLERAFQGEKRFLVAASDHCPGHAYRGHCPGIEVEELHLFRAETSAAFNKMTVDQWMEAVDNACCRLRNLMVIQTPHGEYAVAEEEIEMLNQASLILDMPVQYTVSGNARDPRTKTGILGGSPELISYWMDYAKSIDGLQLVGVYGDPARGYAGGYVAS